MLLTCPNCRSGLQVPEGTTALVRCPACKNVFSPADGTAPESDEEDEEREQPKAKKRKPAREEENEDERPRKKRRARQEDEEEEEEEPAKSENRDFDPVTEEEEKRRKKKRRKADGRDALTPEEKAVRRAAFQRAAWGARLIWISFALFMLSMILIIVFFFQFAFARMISVSPVYITIAGILGLFNWLTAAVGVGLCLSGPQAPGHWRYGILAAVAVGIHLIMVLVLVGQGKEAAVGQNKDAEASAERWGMLPTRLDATMYYLTVIAYREQGFTPKGKMTVSMITGVMEMVRTVCIMMLLSCLARASLDEELAHKCTRAAGIASVGPGLIAIIMFLFVATVVETNAGLNLFTLILLVTVNMGVYSILAGVLMPCFMAAREVDDACEEPFQSLIPQL